MQDKDKVKEAMEVWAQAWAVKAWDTEAWDPAWDTAWDPAWAPAWVTLILNVQPYVPRQAGQGWHLPPHDGDEPPGAARLLQVSFFFSQTSL